MVERSLSLDAFLNRNYITRPVTGAEKQSVDWDNTIFICQGADLSPNKDLPRRQISLDTAATPRCIVTRGQM